jgi:aminomethyltransferase
MMLDDITVFRLAADRVMLVSGLIASEAHFAGPASGLDVELVPLSDERASLQLQGPRSREVLARVTDIDLGRLLYFHCREGQVAGEDCIVSRTGYSGELGYEIFCSPAAAATVWTALLEAGAADGIRPYGLEAADYLRVESGLIFVTFDYMPGEWSPFELGLGWAVKLDKGDHAGKQALRRLATEPARRRIAGLGLDGDDVPEAGGLVHRDGVEIGTITVACRSSLLDRVLALALLEGGIAGAPGTRVQVDGASAEVAALPFHDPRRERPRA